MSNRHDTAWAFAKFSPRTFSAVESDAGIEIAHLCMEVREVGWDIRDVGWDDYMIVI